MRQTFRNTSLSKKDSIDSGSVSRESRVAGILDSGFSSSMSLNSGESRERALVTNNDVFLGPDHSLGSGHSRDLLHF